VKVRNLADNRINRREGIEKSIGWINQTHSDAIHQWIETVWLKDISEDERAGISSSDLRIRTLHDMNLLDLLVAEGTLSDEDGEHNALQLILDADLGLNEEQINYLKQLAKQPLRLYKITECNPGESYSLSQYPDSDAETVVIEDNISSRMFDADDIVAFRLIKCDGAWEATGAIYHIPEAYAPELLKQLKNGKTEEYSKILSTYWLKLVAAHV